MQDIHDIAVLLLAESIRSAALERARGLCRAFGARLHLIVLTHSRLVDAAGRLLPGAAALARAGFLERADYLAHQEVQALRAAGIESDHEVLWGRSGGRAATARIEALSPDLVAKDLEADGGWRWNRVDAGLLNRTRAALLLTRPEPVAQASGVAVAVDLGRPWPCEQSFAQDLAATAGVIAAADGADLDLIQVGSATDADTGEVFEQLARRGAVTTGWHQLSGAAVPAILGYLADHPAGLAVIGAPLRPRGQRLLHGRHAERIALHAGCDILALRP